MGENSFSPISYTNDWRAGSNTNSWARKKAIRWSYGLQDIYVVDLGQCAVQLFQGYAGNEKNVFSWNERETKQLLKRTQARVKNVVLKNRVFLAFISDSGFEMQQKEK